MIRKKKKFERPRKPYEKARILEENKVLSNYGLKNKREIWKAQAIVKKFRRRAKDLITVGKEEQEMFFAKLKKIGLKVNSIADVLALTIHDLLKRRLPMILLEKKLASTPKQARQMIVHKLVRIDGRVVNAPSYLVAIDEEKLIIVKHLNKKPKNVEKEINAGDEQNE